MTMVPQTDDDLGMIHIPSYHPVASNPRAFSKLKPPGGRPRPPHALYDTTQLFCTSTSVRIIS